MSVSIANIGTEIKSIISKTKEIPQISEQERINNFLDSFNMFKTRLLDRVSKIQQLEQLFTNITWLDLKDQEEEKLLKDIISRSKLFYSKSIKDVAILKSKYWRKNMFRTEITEYQNCLEDFEDTIFEVEEIFFSLRKDDEFNHLTNSL